MATKDKKLVPLRFYPDDYEKIRAKAEEEGLSIQKLSEVLFNAFLKHNKEVMRMVRKHVDDNSPENRKKKMQLTDLEADELMRYIEEQSPLKELEDAIKEMEDEQDYSIASGL